MPDITNDAELAAAMEAAASDALESIAEQVLKIFKTEYLRRYVYDSHGPNSIYFDGTGTPTFEFENAWNWTDLKKDLMTLSKEMFYDPSGMGFNPSTFLHGSKYSGDVRENLEDILNKSGPSSSLWLSVSRTAAYWEMFVNEYIEGGQLEKLVTREFESRGFTKI